MHPEASIVIPTYNRLDILLNCLNSLANQTADPASYEIVVVDDGSTDETPETMRKFIQGSSCRFHYIWQENSGRSRARNTGVLAAKGRIVIFLDSDMSVNNLFVAAHIEAHQKPGFIVAGPAYNTTDYKNPSQSAVKIDLSRAFFDTKNVSVEREKLIEAGLFDENFIQYGWEDLELGERLRALGLKKIKAVDAYGYHYQPKVTYQHIHGILKKERERGHTAVYFYHKIPTFDVRLMTLIFPLYFWVDRLFSLFDWPQQEKTFRLLQKYDQRNQRFLFNLLLALMKNHEYTEGLREELCKNQ